MIDRLTDIAWIVIPTYNRDQPFQTLSPVESHIVKITEHIPTDAGLLWHYDVQYVDGAITRHFNVLAVGTNPPGVSDE